MVLLLAACSSGSRVETTPGAATGGGTVVLVSLDGFRWDYLDRPVAPNLQRLARRGVRAQWLTPSFPSITFPNHYTIVTGLYPEHHGIISNNMRDSLLGSFRISDTVAVREPRWWGGEPIWRTAERQGRRAAAFFWPGSEAAIGGAMPWRSMRFDDDYPNAARVDSVLGWLSLPKGEAPSIVTLYYSDTDHSGHDFGPESLQTDSAIARVDSMIGRLVDGLARRGLGDLVNLVVVSDHGMIETSKEQLIVLDDYINLADVTMVDWTPVGAMIPKPGREAAVYDALAKAHPQLKVYRRGEVPARLHFNSNARITPLVLVAEPGWSITSKARAATWRGGGAHGWDPAARGMGAIFVAAGPAFRQGVTVAPFQNIHIYELLAHIIGVTPAPNDGSLDSVRTLLRGVPEQGASPDRIRGHLVTLSSDAHEGRAPGTRGDSLATHYIREALEANGVAPGASDGGWLQSVPLLGVTSGGSVRRTDDATTTSVFGPHEVLISTGNSDRASRLPRGEAIFVGHGVVTGDGKWDDYKGVDVRGKVVVMLEGAPPGPAWQASGAKLLPGQKHRTAVAHGAWAIVSLATAPTWEASRVSYNRERIFLNPDTTFRNPPSLLVHPDAIVRMLGAALPLAEARAQAALPTFRPRPLAGGIAIDYTPQLRPIRTANVLGLLGGSDSTLRSEVVVVTAHHDHLGRDATLVGDQIFNGALDNAIGVAQFLETARLLAAGPRPKRSVIFISTAAEELGLLGAEWYVRQPRMPLAQTIAAVNIDNATPWGRTRDVIALGSGLSSLDSTLAAVAATQGRRMSPDPYPEQGFYRRSDHFAFARAGVPALFAGSGLDYHGHPAGWGKANFEAYLKSVYHRPSDEVQGDWDMSGVAQEAETLAEVVRRVANATGRPSWSATPEAAQYREAQAKLLRTP